MKRILVTDDEEILRMLIVDTLEMLNHKIDEASNGREAIEKILNTDYDLVILDYMMPELTGYEVLERLAQLDKEVTVIMLTAKNQIRDREKVLEVGVKYFMSKPFSPVDLLNLVEDILR